MKEVHYTIAAAVVIPGVVATGVFFVRNDEDRQQQLIQTQQATQGAKKDSALAGLFSGKKDEKTELVVLQPFVVMDGVFSVHLEATGDGSRNTLCTSLPVVHDAVLTELHHTSEDPAMMPPDKHLKAYADAVRLNINDAFGDNVVSAVILSYADMKTFNANYRRMKTGSSKRCVSSKL